MENKNEQEYFNFIKERIELLKKITNSDFKKLNLEEVKQLNIETNRPFLEENKFLKDETDYLHKLMSVLAYEMCNSCSNAFLRKNKYPIEFAEKGMELIKAKDIKGLEKLIRKYDAKTQTENVKYITRTYFKRTNFSKKISNTDYSSEKYLYETGFYIGYNEIKIHEFLNKLPEERIEKIAKNIVKCFLNGCKTMSVDINKKEFVKIKYPLGYERIAKKVEDYLLERNLTVTYSIILCNDPKEKMEEFHKNDLKNLANEKTYKDVLKQTIKSTEKNKDRISKYAGIIYIDYFGQKEETPEIKYLFDTEKNKEDLYNKFLCNYQDIFNKNGLNNTSFTIISYPCPEIGENFEEIFDRIDEINNLDSEKYKKIHQYLIDTLDKGKSVRVIGNNNKTNLIVQLQELKNPDKETLFENCVADVNVPVGEVFTTPKLINTNGKLHVNEVYLRGVKFKDLEIDVENGMITNYNCSVYEKEEDNKKLIESNILKHHETLPIGEFAIGTNTLAYIIARKYKIEDKLDILIAEKTGPHFAFGDTCYSKNEDTKMYNPDKKEIIAKHNEETLKNNYFSCHTDITIPFDEVKEITVICKDDTEIPLIKDGLFVLPGTTELNLKEML